MTKGDNSPLFTTGKNGIFSMDSYDSYVSPLYNTETGNGFDNITTDYTIMYITACSSAAYDDSTYLQGKYCLPRAYLGLTTGGPAYIGNTRQGVIPGSGNKLHRAFLYSLYTLGLTNIGQTIASSKVWVATDAAWRHYFSFTNNLFGDPSMNIWTTQPSIKEVIKNSEKLEVENSLPKEFALYQNYPNPFNPTTVINYDIPKSTNVKLSIFNTLGQEVMKLVDEYKEAGSYSINFNAKNFSSGIYYYTISASDYNKTLKMMILK
jgi:hypothetical protein